LASLNVFNPLSADIPAPVNTTIFFMGSFKFSLKIYFSYLGCMIDEKLLAYLEEFISEKRMRRFNDILSHRTNYITVAIQYRSLDREGWLG
jgi:hypothetical protein